MEPVRLEIFLDDKTLAGIGSVKGNMEMLDYVRQKTMAGLQAQIDKINAEMKEMSAKGIDTSASVKEVQELEKALAMLKKQINDTQQSGKKPLIDGDDPAPKINNLRMSMAQVARELPALTMGPQMFFLAISNNFPMVQDAIIQARKEHDLLVASGKNATPVWQQVASSLVNWQTGLAVGITLLVVYGKEIGEFVSSIMDAEKSLIDATLASEEFADTVSDQSKKTVAAYLEMRREWNALGDDLKAKEKYLDDNKKRLEEMRMAIESVTDADKAFVAQSDEVIDALVRRAEAAAMTDVIQQESAKAVELYRKWRDMEDTKLVGTFTGSPTIGGGTYTYERVHNRDKDEAYEAYRKQVAEIEKLIKYRQDMEDSAIADLEESGIKQVEKTEETNKKKIKAEKDYTNALEELRRKNKQDAISLMPDGLDKELEQLKYNYQARIEEIARLEQQLDKQGKLTDTAKNDIVKAYELADREYIDGMNKAEKEERDRNAEHLKELLEDYKTYQRERKELDEQYAKDMKVLENSEQTDEVKDAIKARKQAYEEAVAGLDESMLANSDFYNKLFQDYANKGISTLEEMVQRAAAVLSTATTDGDGVVFQLPMIADDGSEVVKTVRVSVEEFERLQKRLNELTRKLEKDNPFVSLKEAAAELDKAMAGGNKLEIEDAVENLQAKSKTAISTVISWGKELSDVFGEGFSSAISRVEDLYNGLVDAGTGIAQLASGDKLGGISSLVSGISSLFKAFSTESEDLARRQTEWYVGGMRYLEALRQQNIELAQQRNYIVTMIDDVEQLQWLMEKGFVTGNLVTQWESVNNQIDALKDNLSSAQNSYEELWNSMSDSVAMLEFVSGGRYTGEEGLKMAYEQGIMSDNLKTIYEQWVATGEEIDSIVDQIEEMGSTLREMVIGTTFDSFLSNNMDLLRNDITDLASFTESSLGDAVANAFMYKNLAGMLEPLYNELADMFVNGEATPEKIAEWRKKYEEAMTEAYEDYKDISDAIGISPSSGSSQSGKSGAFTSLTMEQGNKLEGLFTSVQDHVIGIHNTVEELRRDREEMTEVINRIAENTEFCRYLKTISETIDKFDRDGIKVK